MWPFLLSHHSQEHADRCIRVGQVHLCRRCTALWPLCFAVLAYLIVQREPAASLSFIAAWLFLPVGEFIGVHIGLIRYSPSRVWPLSVLAAIGSAHLFYRYLLDPSEPSTWLLAAGFGLPALAAAIYQEMGKNPKVL